MSLTPCWMRRATKSEAPPGANHQDRERQRHDRGADDDQCRRRGGLKLEGALTMFEPSPVLTRKTWAIETTDTNGLKRYYFLMNPDNQKDWDKMDKQFQDWWDLSDVWDAQWAPPTCISPS